LNLFRATGLPKGEAGLTFSFNRLPKRDERKESGLVVFSHQDWLNSAMGEKRLSFA
jgi:hypothetical protein